MRILEQEVPAQRVLDMINARLDNVTMHYNHAASRDNTISAQAMAETKWQLAELKMQFVDLLVDQAEDALQQEDRPNG